MPLMKFLKSLGKKRKQKSKDGKKERRKEKKEEEKREDHDGSRQLLIETEGMIPPQIHGQAVSSPVTARLGEGLTLTINIKGVPPPTVKWFYGTKEIKPCKEFRLKDDGLQYTLHITKVTESLGKKGVCISARNRLGEVKRRVDLKVYKVYSSRRHNALSDSETAKSPDSLLFRKKRKLKLIRPRSSPTLVSDSSGPEDEVGHIAYISTDSVVDDVVYETIRSSARHVEPPRLRPRKPAIYTDSSLYEQYVDYRPKGTKSSIKKSKDDLNDGDVNTEGAVGGEESVEPNKKMLNPRLWNADPDYATIDDIRRRRQSPGTDRRALTWRGINSPSHSRVLDSRRGHDDDDITYHSLQYDIHDDIHDDINDDIRDGIHNDDNSSDSRHPASTASENPYGSLHIASETPYGSLGPSERNYGILKPPRIQHTQDDHLKTESDNFDGYADISDEGSPYGTSTRPAKKPSMGTKLKKSHTLNGETDFVDHHNGPPPRGSPHEAVNQLWAAQAESAARTYNSHPPEDSSQTVPKTPYQDDYTGYMGRQQVLHPFFADELENRYACLPGLDVRNNPHAKTSDYDYSDHGYGTLKSTATDYDSLSRGREKTRASQNDYVTYGQVRQAMRLNSLGRHHNWSPVGGPYGKGPTGRESGYESGYISGLANSESHYGTITFPRRDTIEGPPPQQNGNATFPRRSHSQDIYSTRAIPAPVTQLNNSQQHPPSPHTERFYFRESFQSPISSPMTSPRVGRSSSRVKQTTEIHEVIKKLSPSRTKSLDRESPLRRLPDVLSSQSPRMQSVVETNFAEPIVTRLTNVTNLTSGLDVTDNRLAEVSPDPVSAISQPSQGPVLSPPVTRRPPLPMSTTIIRSRSAGPGVRYSSFRNRSPSPIRRSTQIRTYDITPTPSRFASTSLTSGKPATSSNVKTVASSVSSQMPSPPSYSSVRSSALRAAPDTRYEHETTPKVTSTFETVTEMEHVIIPMKSSSISTVVTSNPASKSASNQATNSSTTSVKDPKSSTVTTTTTQVNGGKNVTTTTTSSNGSNTGSKITTRSSYVSPGASSTSSRSYTSESKVDGATGTTSPVNSYKGKGKRVVEEKKLTEIETKFEVKTGHTSITDALNAIIDGSSVDATDLSSIASTQLGSNPQQNLSSIINELATNGGGIPTLDRSFLETVCSSFGGPEQLIRSLPENLQAVLRNASCVAQNGHLGATSETSSTTEKMSDKDSDKEVDETLSKIGKEDTNGKMVDGACDSETLTFIANNSSRMGMDSIDSNSNDALLSSVAAVVYRAGDTNTQQSNYLAGARESVDVYRGISVAETAIVSCSSNCDCDKQSNQDMCSRDKFLQDLKNDKEPEDTKVKEDDAEFELEDDVFEDQVPDDPEVSLALSRSAAAFNNIEKGALEGILDLSIVNDILQFSDITSEDVLDDDEIEELSQLIIANISDDVRKEIEKDITIKDYVKSVISQACANLQRTNSHDSYTMAQNDGTRTPDHLEGTFYEMEIIEDDEDDKLGQMSPRFLLPPRYDVDCESDQLSAITEEDDEDILKVEEIPKDDESGKEDQDGYEDDTTLKTHDQHHQSPRQSQSLSQADQHSPRSNGVRCAGTYEDGVVINAEDVENGNDVACVYEVSSKFKCIVENYEDQMKDGNTSRSASHSASSRSASNGDIGDQVNRNGSGRSEGKTDDQVPPVKKGQHSKYHVLQNVKEITTTYDIQLVPIPIENGVKSGNHSNSIDKAKSKSMYPEHGVDLEVEVSNEPPESRIKEQSRIKHHDYKTHAQANGIQEQLQLMHDDYTLQDDDNYDDDDDEDDDDDTDDSDEETGMEYDLNDICDVLDFCGDPELQEALVECIDNPSFGEESPLDTPSDYYCYNQEDMDPNNQFGYADNDMLQVENTEGSNGENDDNDTQTLSIDSGLESRASTSMIASLPSRNSEGESPESSTDLNMISKEPLAVSESWTTTVTKVESPNSDLYVCDIAPGEKLAATPTTGASVLNSIGTEPLKRGSEMPCLDDEVFDSHTDCPTEAPIVKPITKMVKDFHEERIKTCDKNVPLHKGLKRKLNDDGFDKHMDVPSEEPINKPLTKFVHDVHETRIETLSKSRSAIVSKGNGFDERIDVPSEPPINKPITRFVHDFQETLIESGAEVSKSKQAIISKGKIASVSYEPGFERHMDIPLEPPINKPITKLVHNVHETHIETLSKSKSATVSNNDFDEKMDVPTEPPINKPISRLVQDIHETRIKSGGVTGVSKGNNTIFSKEPRGVLASSLSGKGQRETENQEDFNKLRKEILRFCERTESFVARRERATMDIQDSFLNANVDVLVGAPILTKEPRIQQVNKSLKVHGTQECQFEMDDDEFDAHMDIPTEPPILKPITKPVQDISEAQIHSASDNQASGASKNQGGTFVMFKNFFRILVPKEVLSPDEKMRFAATINQTDMSVSETNDTVVIKENGEEADASDNVFTGDGVNLGKPSCDDSCSTPKDDDDDIFTDDMAERVVNMLDDPSIMAGLTEAVQAESSSGDISQAEAAACSSQDGQQGEEEEIRVIWHARGLWDELKRNAGSFMLLLIAVILMQIVNHWLSVEGKED